VSTVSFPTWIIVLQMRSFTVLVLITGTSSAQCAASDSESAVHVSFGRRRHRALVSKLLIELGNFKMSSTPNCFSGNTHSHCRKYIVVLLCRTQSDGVHYRDLQFLFACNSSRT
jgi:hypothetical protein